MEKKKKRELPLDMYLDVCSSAEDSTDVKPEVVHEGFDKGILGRWMCGQHHVRSASRPVILLLWSPQGCQGPL
jgi:hypothetical protein